ncbi:MAG TPA: glycine zipper 2TM domain-containing protein [Hyphomonadaceae bacterium]|nr:glycine zipper 2TM domain-containing protein [Hyphomonadaceae bacterium]
MRSFVAYGIGALSAVAIGAAVAMGVNANNEHEIAKQTEVAAIEKDNRAEVASANQRADSAEARAAAAEAKARCEKERQQASNRGAVVGGVTGAVIGSQVAGDGAKSEGGVLGGVAGVLAGRQIAKKDHRC